MKSLCSALILAVLLVTAATGAGLSAQGLARTVGAPRSEFLIPVVITGEVNKAGTFQVIDNLAVAQLLEMAGGLTVNASRTVILVHFSNNAPLSPPSRASLAQLIRAGSSVPRNITLTRIAVVDGDPTDTRIHIEPQDILFVPGKNEG